VLHSGLIHLEFSNHSDQDGPRRQQLGSGGTQTRWAQFAYLGFACRLTPLANADEKNNTFFFPDRNSKNSSELGLRMPDVGGSGRIRGRDCGVCGGMALETYVTKNEPSCGKLWICHVVDPSANNG
jgi:hypothetical protein